MKTVCVKAPFEFEFREEPIPVPGPGQALVEVAYCGICGSDIGFARGGAKNWTPIGHEVSGVVRELGPGVRLFKPGDRVALDCGTNCGVCDECRAGRPKRCLDIQSFYATRSGFGDFLLADVRNLHPIGTLELKAASLLEPFGVAMDMFIRLDIDFLDDVLLIGPGPIGLLALAACKARGARSITVVGRAEGARMEFARRLGAKTFAAGDDMPAYIAKNLEWGFDKILVTAPPMLLPAAVAAARPAGKIVFCGLGEGGNAAAALDWDLVHGKDIAIEPMGSLPARQAQAVELLGRGAIDADAFITHTFKRDEIPNAFATIRGDRSCVIKAVVEVNAAL